MDNDKLLEKLKEIYKGLEEGIAAECEENEKIDSEYQIDCRIMDAQIELEELIDTLSE